MRRQEVTDDQALLYSLETRKIIVQVTPWYLSEHSKPEDFQFVWAYRVNIENHTAHTMQLLKRRWLITDGFGITEEVVGDGVVGEQPTLRPQERYEYTSLATLKTESGLMQGQYQMVSDEGDHVDVAIPCFSLDIPGCSLPN